MDRKSAEGKKWEEAYTKEREDRMMEVEIADMMEDVEAYGCVS